MRAGSEWVVHGLRNGGFTDNETICGHWDMGVFTCYLGLGL
jgi:hypothetical protein